MNESESPKFSNSKLEENSLPKVDESKETNVCPFKFEWAIGMNVEVTIVNLTTRNRNIIAYACSHVVILYDYVSKDMMSLLGHRNTVRSLSASRDGKWLLSADFDEDCVCIVWDTETRVPICSLFNPHGKNCLTAVELSPDAKYLVTVGNEMIQVVSFWIWTRGKDVPDATVELSETSGDRVKIISFNGEYPAEFLLTLNNNVIFGFWRNSKSLDVHRPTISTKNRRAIENLNDSCYISKSQLAMTVTKAGFVLVWSDAINSEHYNSRKSSNDKKRLVKAVPLQKGNLTSIKNVDELTNYLIIAIGNNSGQLFFYDHQLKLLYWCENCGFDSIVSISFDCESELKRPKLENEDIPDSLDKEEKSFNYFKAKEDRETKADEDAEEKICEFEAEPNATKKLILKHKSNSLEGRKEFAASTTTMNIDYQSRVKGILEEPTNCNLQAANFLIPKFFVSSASGKIARLDIQNLKCHFMLQPAEGTVTAIATRPKSDYVVIGNSFGLLCLYKYTTRALIISKRTPPLPDFRKILNFEEGKHDTSYVTCPQIHESQIGVSALGFSPELGGTLACGLESGVIWILDPHTLDPIDSTPYKHSASKILDLIFSECGKYLAYSDDAFTIGVFEKNDRRSNLTLRTDEKTVWKFLGKYHSHCLPVRQILFSKSTTRNSATSLLSLGEDQNLVEYDLENSGPYPEPGLKILQIDRVERTAIPMCMTLYPKYGVESFLIAANSEHKFRLLNDETKTIRATFLGPTFGDPVQRMLICKQQEKRQKHGFMVFATSKDIGLMILPFDGNPHKIVAMTGHPKKIQSMAISGCGRFLFTIGRNDRSLLVWRIKYKSVNAMERLGGKKLSPFYSLVEGGKEGWLFNEIKDLFYYAQILQQGENTTSSRIVTDKVSILQLPNLMRAIGFYPTNTELENMMEEVSYKHYAESGQLVDEITFEEFVKLYINHRPAFGITRKQIKAAFKAFTKSNELDENPSLTAKQFLEILFGRGRNIQNERRFSNEKLDGEPLSIEEAHTYLRNLLPQDEDSASYTETQDGKTCELNFEFLPPNITYENFTEEILGIGKQLD